MLEIKIFSSQETWFQDLITDEFHGFPIITPTQIYQLIDVQGIAMHLDQKVVAAVTYADKATFTEVVTMNALKPGQGFGTQLLQHLEKLSRNLLKVYTSNENTGGLRFYQKCGFQINELHHNFCDYNRKIKPALATHYDGIMINHVIGQ